MICLFDRFVVLEKFLLFFALPWVPTNLSTHDLRFARDY